MRKLRNLKFVVLAPLLVVLCAFGATAQPKAVKPAKRAQSIAKTAEAKLVVSFEKKVPCNDVNLEVALYNRQTGELRLPKLTPAFPKFKPEVFDEANNKVQPSSAGWWLGPQGGMIMFEGRGKVYRSTAKAPFTEKLEISQWFALKPNRVYKIILRGRFSKVDRQGISVVHELKSKTIKIHTLAPIYKAPPRPDNDFTPSD